MLHCLRSRLCVHANRVSSSVSKASSFINKSEKLSAQIYYFMFATGAMSGACIWREKISSTINFLNYVKKMTNMRCGKNHIYIASYI